METIEAMLAAALAHNAAGRLTEAEALCRQILAVEDQIAATEHLLGTIARRAGRLEAARGRFLKAVALAPDIASHHASLGQVEADLGRYEAALEGFRTALASDPSHTGAHGGLSALALQFPGPIGTFYREQAAAAPNDADLQFHCANALFHAGQLADAVPFYRRVLALHPDHVPALDNLGLALSDLGRIDAAIECLGRSVAIAPQATNSHNNLGLALLLHGRYAEAWPHHEYGRGTRTIAGSRRWQGEPLDGARILVHAEQGFGDTLQFVRYVPMVAARGGRVVLEAQAPLRRLLDTLDGVEILTVPGEPLPPDIVWDIPLMSLPYVFGTEVATIPARVPYLSVPAAADQAPWDRRIPGFLSRRVGLVWQGQKGHRRNRERSLPTEALAALGGVAGVSFYCIQKQPPDGPVPPSLRLVDLSAGLGDFADTAAAIRRLDLVITVDTSVAHLAGALGKPVWVLLTHTPDWRWLLDRSDSPWYPTARLFRQPRPGDWAGALHQVADALRGWVTRA